MREPSLFFRQMVGGTLVTEGRRRLERALQDPPRPAAPDRDAEAVRRQRNVGAGIGIGLLVLGALALGAGRRRAPAPPPRRPEPPPRRPEPPPQSLPPAPGVKEEARMPLSEATIRRVEQYTALFSAAAREHQVDRALLMGLCAAESDGQARSGAGTTGYKGLLQAEKDDAQLDPATSIAAGAKKVKTFLTSLARLLGKLGIRFAAQSETQHASQLICAYNAGPGVVVRALARANDAAELPRWMEPRFYVPALVYYGSYSTRAHAKGFSEDDIKQAERWRTVVLKQQELTPADLAEKTFLVDGTYQRVPALVVLSVEKKAADTGGYVAKVLRYATYFRSEEGVS